MATKTGKLSYKQKAFVEEYLIDFNPIRAYKKVYKQDATYQSAAATSSRIVHLPQVVEYIKQRQEEIKKETEVTPEKVVKELASIAFSDPSNYARIVKKPVPPENEEEDPTVTEYDYDMEITPTEEIPPMYRKAIGGIEKTKHGVQYKMCDKVKALELLGKHLGMFNDKVELSGKVDNDITINIVPDAPEDDTDD